MITVGELIKLLQLEARDRWEEKAVNYAIDAFEYFNYNNDKQITIDKAFDIVLEYIHRVVSIEDTPYANKPIMYLVENDPTLERTYEVFKKYGYTVERWSFNSEFLATLLYIDTICDNVIDIFKRVEKELEK